MSYSFHLRYHDTGRFINCYNTQDEAIHDMLVEMLLDKELNDFNTYEVCKIIGDVAHVLLTSEDIIITDISYENFCKPSIKYIVKKGDELNNEQDAQFKQNSDNKYVSISQRLQ